MKFMLFIHASHRDWTQAPPEEVAPLINAHQSFLEDLRQAELLDTAWGLYPAEQASIVRVDQGNAIITDGPFAETKEQIGGFYLIDTETREEALEWAQRLSEFNECPVEVRPVIEDPRWPQ